MAQREERETDRVLLILVLIFFFTFLGRLSPSLLGREESEDSVREMPQSDILGTSSGTESQSIIVILIFHL